MDVFSQPELAKMRGALIESLMQDGFPDMPPEKQAAYGRFRLVSFMDTIRPSMNAAIGRARAAGTADAEIDRIVSAVMSGITEVFEDALRECGLNIEIVPVRLPPRRRRR